MTEIIEIITEDLHEEGYIGVVVFNGFFNLFIENNTLVFLNIEIKPDNKDITYE